MSSRFDVAIIGAGMAGASLAAELAGRATGLVLEAESQIYARPDDPRTANVFDPSIRGKTDQFALRFRKPG